MARFFSLGGGRWLLGIAAASVPWLGALAIQGPSSSPKPLSPVEQKVYERGLAAWRKPGGKFNAACSSCHSPDGFDVAQFGFDDSTIRRRALAHVGEEDAGHIVELIHLTRSRYGIQKPLDPTEDRPLQPGEQVLQGATSADRDLAFGKSLEMPLPTLMTERIDSLAKAEKARQEILAVDPSKLSVGIPFNLWSEDLFHGPKHGTVADWLTDLPCAPVKEKEKAWFDLVDRYLAQPSDTNFWAMYNAVSDHTQPFTQMPFSVQFAYQKYTSTLLAQHFMRRKALGLPLSAANVQFAEPDKDLIPNPFWEVGEYATLNEGLDSEAQGMPEEVRKSFGPQMPLPGQMRSMKVPWLWLGWLQDQGLQRTPGDANTKNARYFTLALYTEGDYALHNLFMITRKQLVQSFDPIALPKDRKQRFIFDFSEVIAHRNAIRYEPQEPERQAMFRNALANALRMGMYLLIEDAKKTGVVESRAISEYQLDAAREYLIYAEPEHKASNVALADRALAAIYAARDSKENG